MDFQRIILIAGVAIISYLMVLQWNQDYGTQAVAPQQVTSVSAYDVDTLVTDFAVAQPSNNSDIVVTQADNADTGSLLEVSTDTLKVVIDTQGGDIIQASLIGYLAEMDHSDVPFTLLEQNQQRTYVAPKWPDRPLTALILKSRPIFNSAQSTYQMQDGQQSLEVTLSLTDDTGALINKIYTFFSRQSFNKPDLRCG